MIRRNLTLKLVCFGTPILVVLMSAYFVATRDFIIGADTVAYARYYRSFESFSDSRFEIGFKLLTHLSKNVLGLGFEGFLVLGYLSFWLFITLFCRYFYQFSGASLSEYCIFLFTLVGAFFLSRWFETSTLNGIRQGLSAAALFPAALCFIGSKYKLSFLFSTAAILFHQSAMLNLAFFPLLLLGKHRIQLVFYVAGVSYLFGLNEKLIELISNFTGTQYYLFIRDFSLSDQLWVGFQPIFFVYTIILSITFRMHRSLFLMDSKKLIFGQLISIFELFSISYFVFGFGAFSNRYAINAWLFSSILFAAGLTFTRLNIQIRYNLSTAILFFGSGWYLFRLLGLS